MIMGVEIFYTIQMNVNWVFLVDHDIIFAFSFCSTIPKVIRFFKKKMLSKSHHYRTLHCTHISSLGEDREQTVQV